MSDYANALTGFGFFLIPENDDDPISEVIDALLEAANDVDGICAELTGNHVIGPMGVFVALEDTLTNTYYLQAEPLKIRNIHADEISKLKQFAEANGAEISDDDIGWLVTAYYG